MRAYFLKRLWHVVPVVLGVSFLVFLMMHMLPVDPVRALLMSSQAGQVSTAEEVMTEEQIREVRKRLGLDKPLVVQFGLWLGRVATGDLGNSFKTGRPVSAILSGNIWPTFQLGVASLTLGTVMGISLGIIAAVRQNQWWDVGATIAAVLGTSTPNFWQGLMLIWIFGLILGWFPSMGVGTWKHLVLPALTLGTGTAAIVARLTRSSLVEILRQDFIRTARAKGLSERLVIYSHALRNALIPVVTIVGLALGGLLSGTVIVENVFGRPGLGSVAVNAIMEKDFPIVQASVLILSLSFVLANLLVDVAYGFIDPRIRYE